MATVYFTAIIEAGGETGYGVFFPDLPGCVSAGDTVEIAARNAEEALSLHLAGMIEDGEEIPSPTPPETVKAPEGTAEVCRMLTSAELEEKSQRYNISMEVWLMTAIDRAATARSTTRSGLLAEAARRMLAAD